MKGHLHNEFSKCHLKAYVTILLASAQGIDALFFVILLSHFVSLAQVFCTSSLCFQTCDIFKFLLWFVTLKALLGSCQHHCPSTSPPPSFPFVSELVIDYSNPPTYFISAALPAEQGTWKFVEWERLLLLYLSSLSFSPPKTHTACIFSSG